MIMQDARQQAIYGDDSYIVQAPAGSGKTALLTLRILNLLTKVDKPEQVLALTFTRKAADEMKHRVLQALLSALQPEPANSFAKQVWQLAKKVLSHDKVMQWQLINNPNRLKIQTIDGFCTRILQQQPIVSKMGGGNNVRESVVAWYKLAVARTLLDNQENAWQQDVAKILLAFNNQYYLLENFLVYMLTTREQWLYSLLGQEGKFVEDALKLSQLKKYINMLGEQTCNPGAHIMPELISILQQLSTSSQDKSWDLGKSFSWDSLPLWQQVADILLAKNDNWRKTVNKQQGFLPPTEAQGAEKQRRLECKQAMLEWIATAQNIAGFLQFWQLIRQVPCSGYNEAHKHLLQAIFKVLPVLVANLQVIFQENHGIDFQENSLRAYMALGQLSEPSELACALDASIKHILVDEFQDTSIAQFNLLARLVQDWQCGDGRSLFLVGDPMQSVYRFRQAEVGLFIYAKDQGIGAIKLTHILLKENFRSKSSIVSWCNNVFFSAFEQDSALYGYISYKNVVAQQLSLANDLPVKLTWCQNEELQAYNLATDLYEFKKNNPQASCAILVRSRTHLPALWPWLDHYNISYAGVDILPLSNAPVVQDLVALLRVLLNLEDRIAWLAILRARWCGLSMSRLLEIFKQDMPIYNAILTQQGNCPYLNSLKDNFAWAYDNLNKLPLDELLYKLWVKIASYCYGDSVDLLINQFFQVLRSAMAGKSSFKIEVLQESLAATYAKIPKSCEHAVEVMTIHKSKGLEFDAVFLPGVTREGPADSKALLLLESNIKQGLSLVACCTHKQESAEYSYLRWLQKNRAHNENSRLFYVAVTRAKTALYIYGYGEDCDKLAKSSLAYKYADKLSWDMGLDNLPDNQNINQHQRELGCYRVTEHRLTANKIIAKDQHKMILSKQDNWQRITGIILHKILWEIANVGFDSWQRKTNAACKKNWLPQALQLGLAVSEFDKVYYYVSKALDTVSSCKFAKWILAKHTENYQEWSLVALHGAEVVEKIIDRAFVDAQQELWVIDYKTICVEDVSDDVVNQAANEHSKQLLTYIRLVKKMRPNITVHGGFYFPVQGIWLQWH